MACNISFPSRSRGYEHTEIQLTLSGENRSKIPETYYHVKTGRSSAYNVEHSDQHVRKFVTPLVNTMMTEINSKAGDNENLKEKYFLKAIASLESNLHFKSDGQFNNKINKSIVDALNNYVCGITTGGSRDKFDQNFINNLAIAAYDPLGDISKTAVARALGGNRKTMGKLFSLQPYIYEQLNTLGKDEEEEDEEETQELLERIEEEEFGLGEFNYNGNFVVDEDILNKILTNNPDIDTDFDNSDHSNNSDLDMDKGEKEDDEDDYTAAGSGAAFAKTKGGKKKREKTIFSNIIRDIGDRIGMGELSVGSVRSNAH